MWLLFRWRRKTFLVMQPRALPLSLSKLIQVTVISSTLQITSAELDRWHSILQLKKYLAATMTKERESAALALVNIHCIMQIGITQVQQ